MQIQVAANHANQSHIYYKKEKILTDNDTAVNESAESIELDAEIVKQLGRAMLAASLEKEADADVRKAKWEESKKEYVAIARKVMRRLNRAGVTLAKSG